MKWYLFITGLIVLQSAKGQDNSLSDNTKKANFVQFIPVTFSNKFSLNPAPVLTIQSGDTISTETIDALGYDKNGVKRQHGGNPLTGPFYIKNCEAGDVLQITLTRVSLNRPYAYTTENFVSRSMPDDISNQFKKAHLVKWKLDLKNSIGWPDSSASNYEHLQNFRIPLIPFLGCIGVAPGGKKNEILSFFQGPFGGNMDFSGIRQSAVIYLPVFHDGGYLYLGDGHALQGDGEIAGNALETSLNVEFTVSVINKDILQLTTPRVEDSMYIMTMGSASKLEAALKIATVDLLVWIQKDYQLSIQEATQVMSTTIEYSIAEIADPDVIVVAKIKKEMLKPLKRQNKNK
jgi:amidase